jgi:hypothetical protein
VAEEHNMTGDKQSERFQDRNTGKGEKFRVLVGARLAKLGAPMQITPVDAQIQDGGDDVDGHAWSVKQD